MSLDGITIEAAPVVDDVPAEEPEPAKTDVPEGD